MKKIVLGLGLAAFTTFAAAQDQRPGYGPSSNTATAKKIAAGVIAIELITAAQGIDYQAPLKTSGALREVHREIRAISPHLTTDRYWADEMTLLQAAVLEGRFEGEYLLR